MTAWKWVGVVVAGLVVFGAGLAAGGGSGPATDGAKIQASQVPVTETVQVTATVEKEVERTVEVPAARSDDCRPVVERLLNYLADATEDIGTMADAGQDAVYGLYDAGTRKAESVRVRIEARQAELPALEKELVACAQ